MDLNKLRQKRASLIAQARQLLDRATGESRSMNQEEENQYNSLWQEINRLGTQIEQEEQLQAAERSLEGAANTGIRPDAAPAATQPGDSRSAEEIQAESRAWNRMLRGQSMSENDRRALQADLDTQGGYLRAPVQFVNRFIQALDSAVQVRQWATVMQVNGANGLGAASLDADPEDADWTGEVSDTDEDTAMSFGNRELHPHPLSKLIKISRKLLRQAPQVEDLVMQRLTYKFAVPQERGFFVGSGAGQPLGVFTASPSGISTGRDVATGNLATEITIDGLIEAKYTLKSGYWRRARWAFHSDAVKRLAKLKDGNGQYIWKESVRAGEPDTLLSFPIAMSDFVPNTFTSAKYVGILGDWSYYWIADALQMEIQRLDELFAKSNQVGFIGRLETDGMPVLEEAFVRVKLG